MIVAKSALPARKLKSLIDWIEANRNNQQFSRGRPTSAAAPPQEGLRMWFHRRASR